MRIQKTVCLNATVAQIIDNRPKSWNFSAWVAHKLVEEFDPANALMYLGGASYQGRPTRVVKQQTEKPDQNKSYDLNDDPVLRKWFLDAAVGCAAVVPGGPVSPGQRILALFNSFKAEIDPVAYFPNFLKALLRVPEEIEEYEATSFKAKIMAEREEMGAAIGDGWMDVARTQLKQAEPNGE